MSVVEAFEGRILDTDSHEFMPAHLWPEAFGPMATPAAQWFIENHDRDERCSFAAPVERDEAPIGREHMDDAWGGGAWAPAAWDMKRRVELLDSLGIAEEFVFPSGVGMLAQFALSATPALIQQILGIEIDEGLMGFELNREVLNMLGREYSRLYNDWCIETASISPRLRPVALIDCVELEHAITEVKRVIAGGVRAVALPSGVPIGDRSPGHPDVDPLWEVLESNNVPLLLHAGGDFGLLAKCEIWQDYGRDSNSYGKKFKSPELGLEPYAFSRLDAGVQNYIPLLIFGGVFERFPKLRVGCIETSAYWAGPMAENLGQVANQFKRMTTHLSLTPAEYFERNIRVHPFWWEPVDRYIERFGLEDVYVFGTDYPHYEGGKDPAAIMAQKLERLGPEVAEKFFVKNAQLLMP